MIAGRLRRWRFGWSKVSPYAGSAPVAPSCPITGRPPIWVIVKAFHLQHYVQRRPELLSYLGAAIVFEGVAGAAKYAFDVFGARQRRARSSAAPQRSSIRLLRRVKPSSWRSCTSLVSRSSDNPSDAIHRANVSSSSSVYSAMLPRPGSMGGRGPWRTAGAPRVRLAAVPRHGARSGLS